MADSRPPTDSSPIYTSVPQKGDSCTCGDMRRCRKKRYKFSISIIPTVSGLSRLEKLSKTECVSCFVRHHVSVWKLYFLTVDLI